MVRLHLRLEGERLPYRIRSARLPEWGPEPSFPRRHCLRDSSSLWDAVPSLSGRKCYGSTLALHAISGSSTLPRPSFLPKDSSVMGYFLGQGLGTFALLI